MIDFHAHILHGIDDGARILDHSLAMARVAVEDGITSMVATPHSALSRHGERYTVDLVQQRVAQLQSALDKAEIPLRIIAGTELYYHPDLVKHLQQGIVLPCGTHGAILLECPDTHLPSGLDTLIFDMQVANYRVVLAHPERIKTVQHNPNVLIPLIERGVLMQVTAHSLTGGHGKRIQRVAETLVCHGMIHLIASDSHGLPPRRARPPLLNPARHQVAILMGADYAAAMVKDTPAALLNGTPLTLPTPEPVRWTQRVFGFLF